MEHVKTSAARTTKVAKHNQADNATTMAALPAVGHRNLRGDGGVSSGREDAAKVSTHTTHLDRSGDEGRTEQTNFTARGTAVVNRMLALRVCAAPQRSRSSPYPADAVLAPSSNGRYSAKLLRLSLSLLLSGRCSPKGDRKGSAGYWRVFSPNFQLFFRTGRDRKSVV